MLYGEIPGIDKPLSRIVHGTIMVTRTDQEKWNALLDHVLANGGNTFDTAWVYGGGDNERGVGVWVNDRGVRDKVVLIAKGAHHNPDRRRVTPFDIQADVHDSLARFKTDYIDLYLLHRDDPSVPVGPIVETLNALSEEGKINAYGGSNWSYARIAEANAYAAANGLKPFVASSPQFSLAEQVEEPWAECVSLTGPDAAADRKAYGEADTAIMAWSSLAGGFLTGRITRDNVGELAEELCVRCYAKEENFQRLDRMKELCAQKNITLAQLAIAYVLNYPMNTFALTAAYTPEEWDASVVAADITLTDEEMAWLNLED